MSSLYFFALLLIDICIVKFVAAYILLLSLIIQSLSGQLINLQFKSAQSRLAEQLCENKARPVMKCLGKCQLQKKLESKNNLPGSASHENLSQADLLFSEE